MKAIQSLLTGTLLFLALGISGCSTKAEAEQEPAQASSKASLDHCQCGGGYRAGAPCTDHSDCASNYCANNGTTRVCGIEIEPEETYCGFSATGTDGNAYVCCEGGWVQGTTCPVIDCTCYNGWKPGLPCSHHSQCPSDYCATNGAYSVCGIAIDPEETFCGYSAQGTDMETYVCCPNGWVLGTICG
ncbi:hypothetical protein LXT21_20095 [Myxococcus sp. K38C18041901]|uniref:hypothetical protein n=1 Tax=Myxococcus guangdongensis TaxID=2906760 RepID=UPI0020A6E075|nr:hypothetical protein [Myxococcus guangdongensis]MCP3061087.1 hypothetical protein [Myxococcus guangdongensis]